MSWTLLHGNCGSVFYWWKTWLWSCQWVKIMDKQVFPADSVAFSSCINVILKHRWPFTEPKCFAFNFLPGESNVYPITEQYGAQHGYTVQFLPLKGLVELRASYFSPHTENKVCIKLDLSDGCPESIPWNFMLTFKWVLSGWQDVHVQIQPVCGAKRWGHDLRHEWDLLSPSPLVPQRGDLWGQLHGGKGNWLPQWLIFF